MTHGTPGTEAAIRLLLLGSGELGREIAIEAMRLGVEVIAADRYPAAPAMQVAHRFVVVDMLDGAALRALVEQIRPTHIVPEVEAIATEMLVELEAEGWAVTPTARATRLTMDREGIRRLAAEQLGLPTSAYRFATDPDSYREAVTEIGLPCVVKPVMSSSGKGQSVVHAGEDPDAAWVHAQSSGRVAGLPVIVEALVEFDYEITLLTVRHAGGTTFCPPIGHRQERGDYMESWQPHPMPVEVLAEAQRIAARVTEALGGWGVFGVELFVTADGGVLFSEVSPRPHDTGMVTLISQPQSEFALHVRAVLGLPISEAEVAVLEPAASAVVLAEEDLEGPEYEGVAAALAEPGTQLRLFAKPVAHRHRRMGVALATASDVAEARARAARAAGAVTLR